MRWNDYDKAILTTYRAATATHITDGLAWYPGMTAIMHAWSDVTGLSAYQCAGVYACNSIQTRWSINQVRAAQDLQAYADNGTLPHEGDGRLGLIARYAARVIMGEDINDVVVDKKSLKIRNFTRNLSGDYNVCTVDTWAYRIATGWSCCPNGSADKPCGINKKTGKPTGKHACGTVPKGAEYEAMAASYARVASYIGINVAALQAITWCVVRGDGE